MSVLPHYEFTQELTSYQSSFPYSHCEQQHFNTKNQKCKMAYLSTPQYSVKSHIIKMACS